MGCSGENQTSTQEAGGMQASGGASATSSGALGGSHAVAVGGRSADSHAASSAGGQGSSKGGNASGGFSAASGGKSASAVSGGAAGLTTAASKASAGGGSAAGGTTGHKSSSAAGGATSAGGVTSVTGGNTAAGGTSAVVVEPKTPGTAASGAATVDPSKERQEMDGFGIADVWQGKSTSSAAQRTLFWDPEQGIGMTILRVGIDENGKIMGDAAFLEAPDVVKYGGKVWAAPWSPTAKLKDNNNINNGGHLLSSAYESWATTLAAFPAYFKENAGVELWGLSAQNEPDYVANYRSCIFDKTQMNNFIKVLGPKLKALDPPVHLLAAEPDTWGNTWSGDNFGTAIVGDATVSALVDIIATHDYDHRGAGNTTTRPSPPAGVKQHIWQTETTLDSGAGIAPGLAFAKAIYAAVNSGGASGWVYWWTPEFMNGGSTTSPPKRVYAMGNYSKFVRPGFKRVEMSGVPSSVQVLAFKNPTDNGTVIVALNSGSSPVTLPVFVAGSYWPASVTPYVTDASSDLAAKTPINVTAANFSVTLGAQSVTTLVGKS